MLNQGQKIHQWMVDLFPGLRSITGQGFRDALQFVKEIHPELVMHSVPSGTKAFDWTVPQEWELTEAYITDEAGEIILDFKNHNLHIMGYSIAVDRLMSLEELQPHLYSLPEAPDAIPYVTAYYRPHWGFCLTHEQRQALTEQQHHVVIKSRHFDGQLNYGEIC